MASGALDKTIWYAYNMLPTIVTKHRAGLLNLPRCVQSHGVVQRQAEILAAIGAVRPADQSYFERAWRWNS